MAGLRLGYQVLVDNPAAAFGFQKTPPYMRSDAPEALAGNPGISLSGLRIIPEAGVIILEPFANLTDTRLSNYEFPTTGSTDWTEGTDSATQKLQLLMTNAAPDNPFDIRTNSQLAANSAFYVRLQRGQLPVGATAGAANYYTVLLMGGDDPPSDDNNDVPVRLVLEDGKPPFLQMATVDDAGAWYWGDWGVNGVVGTEVADCSVLFEEQNRSFIVEWLPFPGQNALVVNIANGKEKLVLRAPNFAAAAGDGLTYDQTNNISVVQGKLRYYGMNGSAGFGYYPILFKPFGYIVSPEFDIPFVLQDDGGAGVYLPDSLFGDDTAFVGTLGNLDFTYTRLKYMLQIYGTSDPMATSVASSPIIKTIQVRIPPVFDNTAVVSDIVDISSRIAEIEENQYFDRQSGLVRTQVGLKFDNTYGDFSSLTGAHRAIKYSRWLMAQANDGTMQPLTAPIDYLIGWAGMKSSVWKADPRREFDCIVEDMWFPLERDCGVLPPLDGWCFLSAIRFLCNMAGLSDAYIGDMFKTCDFGPNPAGCPHFKLTLGVGTSPAMTFGPNTHFIDCVSEILSFVHGVAFFNSEAVLQSFPYYPGIYQTPFKGTFQFQDSGDPANSDFLSAIWGKLAFNVDTSDRRTGVAFFGKDLSTNSPQGTYLNIDDFVPGFTANMHGFNQPWVQVSRLFVDPVFTAGFALAALEKITVPAITMTNEACFLPNLFALDQIAVNVDAPDLQMNIPLSVESIQSSYSNTDPSVMRSVITSRWSQNL
jgi:hypothetical protein